MENLEQHEDQCGVKDDQKSDHDRLSCPCGTVGATASLARASLIVGDADRDGTMNAQISASGQIRPQVATPIQPATFTAAA